MSEKNYFANDFLKIVNLCKKILPCILRALSYENACTRLELFIGNSPVFSRHCKPKLSASHDKQTNRYSSETPNQFGLYHIKSVCRNKKSQHARMNGWVRGSRPPPPVLVKFSTFSPKQICNGAIIKKTGKIFTDWNLTYYTNGIFLAWQTQIVTKSTLLVCKIKKRAITRKNMKCIFLEKRYIALSVLLNAYPLPVLGYTFHMFIL